MRRAAIIAIVVAAAAPARAQTSTVAVKVVEVAGGRAYLQPGAAAGIVAGTEVRVGGVAFVVVDATDGTAAIDVGTAPIAVGATGTAVARPAAHAQKGERMAAPRPLDAFRGMWPDAVRPATVQEVKPVALGSGVRHGAARVTVLGSGMAFVPRTGHADATASIGARATWEPYQDKPLALDADAAAQIFYANGGDAAARPYLVVREARVRWGSYADPRFAAGRLRWAASSVGLLDGARLAGFAGGVELAAFGGLVPDPMGGKPSTDASRFGVELVVDRPRMAWAPRVAVTAHGSTWQGQLDERRLDAVADATSGPWTFGGYTELSAFSAGNPWGDRAVELTSAGADVSWHDGGLRGGIDLSFRRPEHSLRLDAFLPPGWLCTRDPQPAGATSEPCFGHESRTQATGSLAWIGAWGSIDAGATAIHATGSNTQLEGSGFVDTRVHLVGATRVELGVSGGRASFLDWIGGRVGLGFGGRRTDVSVYYRPSMLGYTASTAPFLEHRAGVELGYTPHAGLLYGLIVEGETGADADALTAIATLIWRPR